MNPFTALGIALETVGLWVLSRVCCVVGHRWEAEYMPYPGVGSVHEADVCRRCWRVEYAHRAPQKEATPE